MVLEMINQIWFSERLSYACGAVGAFTLLIYYLRENDRIRRERWLASKEVESAEANRSRPIHE